MPTGGVLIGSGHPVAVVALTGASCARAKPAFRLRLNLVAARTAMPIETGRALDTVCLAPKTNVSVHYDAAGKRLRARTLTAR